MPAQSAFTWYERDGRLQSLDIDAIIREGGSEVSEVTENPIERGSPVADHVREKMDQLTLEFVITNTPLRAPLTNADGATATIQRDDVSKASVLVFSAEFDRVESVRHTLARVRTEALLCTVYTPLRAYENFVIEQSTPERNQRTGDSAKFVLTLRKIRTVNTRIVAIPPRRRRVAPTQPLGAQPTEVPRNSAFSGIFRRLRGDTNQ